MNITIKKFFKKTVKFLFDTALIAIMLVSAQHAMNLPIGWACFGYGAIFCAALIVWTYKQGQEFHKEDINTYAEIYQFTKSIFVYADDGEDEFTIIAPNEIISNPYIKFLTHNILWHNINNNYYQFSSMINKGKETEFTFTKITD